jgi:hypothetical protein
VRSSPSAAMLRCIQGSKVPAGTPHPAQTGPDNSIAQ